MAEIIGVARSGYGEILGTGGADGGRAIDGGVRSGSGWVESGSVNAGGVALEP